MVTTGGHRPGHNGGVDDWLAAAARRRPRHPFVIAPGISVSFEEMDQAAARLAGGLAAAGVGPGDRVGLWVGQDPATVRTLFAIPRTGATVVPLDPRWDRAAARRRVEVAEVTAVMGDGPDLGLRRLLPVEGPPRWFSPRPDHLHWVLFTSGSSGTPKGVRLTWANLEASAAASAEVLGHRPDDVWLHVLPLAHVAGLMILVRSAREATTVLLEPGFHPQRVAALLRTAATLSSFVATQVQRILDRGPFPRVRAVLVGGGPIPAGMVEAAATAGLPVLRTYGMTETASQVATAREPGGPVLAVPGAELRTVGGRIQVRGPMVSPGYLDGPDREPDDWFDTGDLGSFDAEVGLEVHGRADDVIITGGENVMPGRVEQVIAACPGVREAAVVGVPDGEWGVAVAVAYEGDALPEAVEAFARERLASFEVPKRWRRLDRLPRLPLGKVDRTEVRKLFDR